MSWLWTILVGLVAGSVAKWVMPGARGLGLLLTICLGIGGSIVATFIGQTIGWYGEGDGARFIASTLGAILIVWLWGKFVKK